MATYADPSTGEWVGEYATRDAQGETHRRTEWFATEAAARHFARTGQMRCRGCGSLNRLHFSVRANPGEFPSVLVPCPFDTEES